MLLVYTVVVSEGSHNNLVSAIYLPQHHEYVYLVPQPILGHVNVPGIHCSSVRGIPQQSIYLPQHQEYVYLVPQPILGHVNVPCIHCSSVRGIPQQSSISYIPTTTPGVCVFGTTANTGTCECSRYTL